MKKNLPFILILFFSLNSFSQSYMASMDIEAYLSDTIGSEYNKRFSKETDKTNFKLLREFLREKKDLLNALQLEVSNTINPEEGKKYVKGFQAVIKFLNDLMKAKNQEGNIIVANLSGISNTAVSDYYYYRLGDYYYSVENYFYYNYDANTYSATETRVQELIDKYTEDLNSVTNKMNTFNNLNKNIKNVSEDIYACESQIDSALAPEYKEQEFRTSISLYFTILIGVLLVVFFFIVYKRSDEHLSKELLSGYGLQFVTLFVLIIAIILFGILNILQGSELAAILAGISGYILGKGVPDKKKDGEIENPS